MRSIGLVALSVIGCGRIHYARHEPDASQDGAPDVGVDADPDARTDAPSNRPDVVPLPCDDLLRNGTHEGTRLDATGLVLDGAPIGVYTSPVCDARMPVRWARLLADVPEPYGKGLSATADVGYERGAFDPSGLVALFDFDEASGAQVVDRVAALAAVATDGDGTMRRVPGVFGDAMQFDGVDDVLTVTDDGRFDFADGDFTLLVWARTTMDCPLWCGFLGRQVRADGGFTLELNGMDSANFFLGYLTREFDNIGGVDPINDDAFHLVTGVRNGPTGTLFVDGVSRAAVASLTYPRSFDSDAPFEIGGYSDGAAVVRAAATLDEVAVFARPLSEPEIVALHRRGALQIEYTVRTCDDPACDGEVFLGPGREPAPYVDPPGAPGPPTFVLDHPDARYAQIRVRLVSRVAGDSPVLRGAALEIE